MGSKRQPAAEQCQVLQDAKKQSAFNKAGPFESLAETISHWERIITEEWNFKNPSSYQRKMNNQRPAKLEQCRWLKLEALKIQKMVNEGNVTSGHAWSCYLFGRQVEKLRNALDGILAQEQRAIIHRGKKHLSETAPIRTANLEHAKREYAAYRSRNPVHSHTAALEHVDSLGIDGCGIDSLKKKIPNSKPRK